mmetsp:Transcript_41795/g.63842  ORF Transcript_41795/g.63842 Transcript_41795/m.63842 type:complete len:91 (+) Transcript_41795:179-451(+)
MRNQEPEETHPTINPLTQVQTPSKEKPVATAKQTHNSSTNLEQLLEAVDRGTYEKQELIHASPAPNFDADLQSASSSKLKLEEVQSSASK